MSHPLRRYSCIEYRVCTSLPPLPCPGTFITLPLESFSGIRRTNHYILSGLQHHHSRQYRYYSEGHFTPFQTPPLKALHKFLKNKYDAGKRVTGSCQFTFPSRFTLTPYHVAFESVGLNPSFLNPSFLNPSFLNPSVDVTLTQQARGW